MSPPSRHPRHKVTGGEPASTSLVYFWPQGLLKAGSTSGSGEETFGSQELAVQRLKTPTDKSFICTNLGRVRANIFDVVRKQHVDNYKKLG